MSLSFSDDVKVTIRKEKYRTEAKLGDHTILADEPVSAGGQNLGPEPTRLLLASLGSCTAITLRMYADRKGNSLDSVEVSLNMEKVDNIITRIHRKVHLEGILSEAERERLLQVANACPVHKILSGSIEIQTELH